MANWETKNISDVVKEIDEKKFVLPVIQRRLVWEEEKIELLFDTLLKGESFGGIIVIREDKDTKPLFPFRPFTKDGQPINSAEVEKIVQQQSFVVDGQQRLQSFYIGLCGSINGKLLYFDLFSNFNTTFEFDFESDFNKLPKISSNDSEKTINKYKWYSANDLFQELNRANNDRTVAKSIIARDNIIDETEKEHIEENVAAFFRNIFSGKSLGISEVSIDKTIDELVNRQRIVELFKRLNDGGTKLSSFDLVASFFKGFDWKMERFLEDNITKYEDIGLTQDNLIKLIFLLQDNHKKEMTDISADDARFVISFESRISNALISLKQFLTASDLINYYKDGTGSFIPLFFIVYHVFHKKISDNDVKYFFDNHDTSNSEYPKMKKWLYYSLINGVFRSRGAGWIPYKTGIRKILDKIETQKNEEFPILELFKIYREHGVVFSESIDTSRLDLLDRKFLYYLIYDRKLTIRIQDVDHIMPKSILESLKYDLASINSVANFQLIDYSTNRGEKNAKPFQQWINTLPNKDGFVKQHLIPPNQSLWVENKFQEFTNSRNELILSKINSYLGN